MRGYVIHHRSHEWNGIRADLYRNDPYVWATPYLWSFCHLAQKPRIEPGMTVLWLSKADGMYVCDLVFVVACAMPLEDARRRFGSRDHELDLHHFERGLCSHPDAHVTYVADMSRSYVPVPAVPLEKAVDRIRSRESHRAARPLKVTWRRPSAPLRIEAIDELECLVRKGSREQLSVAIDRRWYSPEQLPSAIGEATVRRTHLHKRCA